MGSFIGHFGLGMFSVILGFRWCWTVLHRYYAVHCLHSIGFSNSEKVPPYKNYISSPILLFGHYFPLEGALKLFFGTVVIIVEYGSAFKGSGFDHHSGQHMALEGFIILHGLMDLMEFYSMSPLPDLSYVSTILLFGIEAFIISGHLDGKSLIETKTHVYLVYLALAIAVCVLLSYTNRSNVMAAMSSIYFLILQGTWLIQMAFIIFPISDVYKWDLDSHWQMMTVTTIFACHVLVVFIFLLLVSSLISRKVRNMDQYDQLEYVNRATHTKRSSVNLHKSDDEIPAIIKSVHDDIY